MFREQRVRSALLRTLAVLLLLLVSAGAVGASASQAPTSSTAGASNMTATASCNPAIDFDSNNFAYPTKINNKWLPLVPGTQLILEGRANRGGVPLPH